MRNADDPAMPFTDKPEYQHRYAGLTKREAFAMAAMQGIMSNAFGDYIGQSWADDMASDSVKAADALLKELDNEQI